MQKTFLITFIATFLFSHRAIAQSCLPGGIAFYSQTEVNNFRANYPGCTVIEGDVRISGGGITNLDSLKGLTAIGGQLFMENLGITSLGGLSNLTHVGGDFTLYNINKINNLSGLENLSSLTGGLDITANDNLVNLIGLSGLDSIGQFLFIRENQKLLSLNGADNLKAIGESLRFFNNDQLTDLSGLESLISIGAYLNIEDHYQLQSLAGLDNLLHIGAGVRIVNNMALSSLAALKHIKTLPGYLQLQSNPLTSLHGLDSLTSIGSVSYVAGIENLVDLSGLEQLITITGEFSVVGNSALKNVKGLENLTTVAEHLTFRENGALGDLDGLQGLTSVGGNFTIEKNGLINLQGLENLISVGARLDIRENPELENLSGLSRLVSVGSDLFVSGNDGLTSLAGMDSLITVGGGFLISYNPVLTALNDFEKLTSAGILSVTENKALTNLAGFKSLTTVGSHFSVYYNTGLVRISGFEKLAAIGGNFSISYNFKLNDIGGLKNLSSIAGSIEIRDNYPLAECSIFAVCSKLIPENFPNVFFFNNAPGCNTELQIRDKCNTIPVTIGVLVDNNGDCLADPGDTPVPGALVQLTGNVHTVMRSTGENGVALFGYADYVPFTAHLPQFPSGAWALCPDSIFMVPGPSSTSLNAAFLLSPQQQCPELTAEVKLPPFFRGCLVNTEMEISTRNTGAVPATEVQLSAVMPAGLELLASAPAPAEQSGDTLFFDLGDLPPFAGSTVKMTVKTSCNTFLLGHTLCVEAFARMGNTCPDNQPPHSEIKLSAECTGDTTLRFTLKNTGDAPTQGPHDYVILKNADKWNAAGFSLAAGQSMAVDVPADGSTWRMEATKFDDGTRTAAALENCGGLTPGLITAFWLDRGPAAYDLNCRQVIGSYDPNQKVAVPAGAGPDHLLAANQPLQYTIEFQNTGTDTAFRVTLYDYLPPELDISTFRPGLSSHPCSWHIRDNILEVLYDPIALPDSNVNEPASHGFFTFSIDQQPDLPDGTVIQNFAAIVFDVNPAIWTNTVQHIIGQPLPVHTFEPSTKTGLWQVWGNPARSGTTFQSREFIPGEKQFELYDVWGRVVKATQFPGQAFRLQRDGLAAGLYFFRISDAQGRVFSEKLIVAD